MRHGMFSIWDKIFNTFYKLNVNSEFRMCYMEWIFRRWRSFVFKPRWIYWFNNIEHCCCTNWLHHYKQHSWFVPMCFASKWLFMLFCVDVVPASCVLPLVEFRYVFTMSTATSGVRWWGSNNLFCCSCSRKRSCFHEHSWLSNIKHCCAIDSLHHDK